MYFPSRRIRMTHGGGRRITIQGAQYPITFVKARFVCIHCLYNLMSRDAGVICSANDNHYGYIRKDEAEKLTQQERFMKIGQMFPSEYLRGIDVGSPYIVTIAAVNEEQAMSRETNKLETEYVMTFKETEKKLRLNITMAKECMLIAGDKEGDSDNWIGKKVTVYRTEVKAFGKSHIVPRLRKTKSGDKPFGATSKKNTPKVYPFPTIDDLLFELSKPPCNLKEDKAKEVLKSLEYSSFKKSKGQEMYDSVVAYMVQNPPTDEQKRSVVDDAVDFMINGEDDQAPLFSDDEPVTAYDE